MAEVDETLGFDCELNLWYPVACSGRAPSPRQGHSAVMMDEQMIVFGGSRRRVWFNDVHSLDTRTLRWSSLDNLSGKPPQPRSYHNAVALNATSMLVFGGNSAECAFNDAHILSLGTGWSKLELAGGSRPGVRCGACLVGPTLTDGTVVLAGGWDVLNPKEVQVFDDVWQFSLDASLSAGCWVEEKSARIDHVTGAAAWIKDDDIFLFGGQGAPPLSKRNNTVSKLQCTRLGADKATISLVSEPKDKTAADPLTLDELKALIIDKCVELGLNTKVAGTTYCLSLHEGKIGGKTTNVFFILLSLSQI